MDITKILSNFLGNKSDRDMKDIYPLVDKIQEVYNVAGEDCYLIHVNCNASKIAFADFNFR